ncbi:MAG: LON peptidase substrate-binding domain-containing protein [Chloroflexota bacterium]
MDLPLFPLNLVFFPGQVLPLHIFEPRYREMINHCLDTRNPFGIILLPEGASMEDSELPPHTIGTAARIVGVERLDDGRMNITTIGTKRFKVQKLLRRHSYLSAEVRHYPVINGNTKLAMDLAQKVRPRILSYVNAIASASRSTLPLNKLPEDPTSLAFLVAMALQVENEDKQKLLSLPSIPDILAHENYMLWREVSLLEHMLQTHAVVEEQTAGPTGWVFPN